MLHLAGIRKQVVRPRDKLYAIICVVQLGWNSSDRETSPSGGTSRATEIFREYANCQSVSCGTATVSTIGDALFSRKPVLHPLLSL